MVAKFGTISVHKHASTPTIEDSGIPGNSSTGSHS